MVWLHANPSWHYTALDEAMIEKIVDAIPKVMIDSHVAALCGIPKQKLSKWLKLGRRDMEEERKDSIFAALLERYNRKHAEVLSEKLTKLGKCPKNYGAITWTLERCYKEDFRLESETERQLHHLVFNVIAPMMQKEGIDIEHLKERIMGEGQDGEKELYQGSDQEAGGTPPGVEGPAGQENTGSKD